MSNMTTLARPYAKAIFEYANAEKNLSSWSEILLNLSQIVLAPEVQAFIANPLSKVEQQTELLMSIFSKFENNTVKLATENLLALLAENKRLPLLPDISAQFEALRAEQEKTLAVTVSSFSSLSDEQQQDLIASLSQRLQRQISLDISIDKSLLGGAVIRAGDLVIDGSVRGKLNKLGTDLAA